MELQVKQRSDLWFEVRRKHFTASEIDALMTGGKTRETYIEKKVNEWLGIDEKAYKTEWMQRGIDFEDDAREAFARATLSIVRECGFLVNPIFRGVGGSPDGIIERTWQSVEIKIPTPKRFMSYRYIVDNDSLKKAERKYYTQMQTCMMLGGFQSGYFVAYCPEAGEGRNLHYALIRRDESYIRDIASACEIALRERDTILSALGRETQENYYKYKIIDNGEEESEFEAEFISF